MNYTQAQQTANDVAHKLATHFDKELTFNRSTLHIGTDPKISVSIMSYGFRGEYRVDVSTSGYSSRRSNWNDKAIATVIDELTAAITAEQERRDERHARELAKTRASMTLMDLRVEGFFVVPRDRRTYLSSGSVDGNPTVELRVSLDAVTDADIEKINAVVRTLYDIGYMIPKPATEDWRRVADDLLPSASRTMLIQRLPLSVIPLDAKIAQMRQDQPHVLCQLLADCNEVDITDRELTWMAGDYARARVDRTIEASERDE